MFFLLDSGANLSCIPYCNAFLYWKEIFFGNINQNTSLKHSLHGFCVHFLKKPQKNKRKILWQWSETALIFTICLVLSTVTFLPEEK